MRSAKGVDILINRKIDIAVLQYIIMVVAITQMMIMVLLFMAISVKTCPCVLVHRASDTEICL